MYVETGGHLQCWLRTSCSQYGDSAAGQGWPRAGAQVAITARSPLSLGCRSHVALEGGEGAAILRTRPPPSQPRVARDPSGPALPCDLGWAGGPCPHGAVSLSANCLWRWMFSFILSCSLPLLRGLGQQGPRWHVGGTGAPGQVGTELRPLPAVPDCPGEEPHEEEVGPFRLTPQQCHRHREHTGGAGEKVGGAGRRGWGCVPSDSLPDPHSAARQNRWEGVPALLPLCPTQRQLYLKSLLCTRHQGPLIDSHEPFSSTQQFCWLPGSHAWLIRVL